MTILVLLAGSCRNGINDMDVYVLSYDGNGATSGTVPAESTSYSKGDDVTVLENINSLALAGYNFAGWNTAADGSGTAYTAGSTLTIGKEDITLYAVWSKNLHTLSFNANGGEGTMASKVIAEGTAYTVPACDFILAGNGCTGWNTLSDGTGTDYGIGSTITMGTSDIVLYAQWSPEVVLTISSAAGDYTNNSSFTVVFSFNKDVTGFDSSDVSVTNGSMSNFTGSGKTYTADVAPSAEGSVIITAAAEAAVDSDGYLSKETSSTIEYDLTAPSTIDPTLQSIGGGQMVISWNEPADADDPSFDHVLVRYNSSPEVRVEKGTGSYTFSGLSTGTSYCPLLVAVDAAGNESGLGEGRSAELYDDTLRNVYFVDSAVELAAMANDLSGYYIFDNNITLSSWTPVGSSSSPFTGIIDGRGNEITGMTISSGSYKGLLGYAASARVVDLSIDGSIPSTDYGNNYLGLLAGYFRGGTIEGVSISGTIGDSARASYVGGLAGYINGTTIESCYSSAVLKIYEYGGGLVGESAGTSSISFSGVRSSSSTGITGSRRVGGLVGFVSGGTLTISQCFTDINISATNGDNVAGLCGRIGGTLNVDNCYTTGNVTGTYTSCVGGLFGYSDGTVNCTNSYARGAISGGSYTGALYGYLRGTYSTTGCYYSTNTGQSSVRGDGGGSGTEIDDASMADIITLGGWDSSIWSTSNGYPYLVNNPYTF